MTPLRQQYLRIKKRFPDTIVMFRLGDFYETFDDDAKIVSSVCNIVLTGRDMGTGNRVPLAGVPYHAIDNYLARLIQAGHKVAIVEQTIDEATAQAPNKGLMEREVVRVVTPGTIIEPGMLEAKRNNYLAALVVDNERAGIAYADITTGAFCATELAASDARQEIDRLHPAELLAQRLENADRRLEIGEWRLDASRPQSLIPNLQSLISITEFRMPDVESARRALLDQFQVASLDGFGLIDMPLATRAAGAIVQYLQDNQKAALAQLTALRTYSTHSFMTLDPATRRNLELVASIRGGGVKGSLLGVLDETRTPMGGRLLREWLTQPLLDLSALNARLDRVDAFYRDTARRESLRNLLKGVADVERLTNRVVQGVATPRDLLAIRASLEVIPRIKEIGDWRLEIKDDSNLSELGKKPAARSGEGEELARSTEQSPISNLSKDSGDTAAGPAGRIANPRPRAVERGEVGAPSQDPAAGPAGSSGASWAGQSPVSALDDCPDVVDLIQRAISSESPATLASGGVIAPGYSAELDGIVSASRNAKDWVAGLERKERERTGIKSLKVGYNKVFGYYIEITTPNLPQAPADYIRKQTLVNAERFITPELKEYESLILNAEERIVELETTLFREVCAQVAGAAPRLLGTARALAELDVYASLAEVAIRYRYVRPQLTDGDEIRIIAGRHPVVELTLKDEPFVPNDVVLTKDELIQIITGPNMSGKSTFLRQVALIVLMGQIGSFVPAEEATIGLVDRIFTRIGAQDEITAGQSTFMVEMVETANILAHGTPKSLIILDEIGRGTSTYDGIALARAIIEHIHSHPKLGAKTLFATHYHELIELEKYLPRVRNYNVAVLEQGSGSGRGRVVFMHKIVRGGADKSYGIHVAQLAGIPKAVVHRAEEVLKELENGRAANGRQAQAGIQLALFGQDDALRQELADLDVLSLSPLEALNKLFELVEKAKGTKGKAPKE